MMETKKITLSQIGVYNPQRLSDDVAELVFIARKKDFSFLMGKILSEKPKSIPQHHLIIAQRGMGKTSMLKRIEVELRKPQHNKEFIPLLFPEEQYNVNTLSTFWLNALDALANSLELNNELRVVEDVDEKIKAFSNSHAIESSSRTLFHYLLETTKHLKLRPVMLIDNMSIIFDRLTKEDQHELRAQLMKNGAPILVGASAVSIDQTHDYGAAFYDAFQIHYFNKLSFEELIDILNNLARLTHTEETLPSIQNSIGRLKTIHELTGGNPRTATMLFKLIVKGFANNINDDLEALLDEITPLYKARFEELSPQMQIIVDAVALNWDPINLEELRKQTGLENHQLSSPLGRLVESGWLEKLNAYKAKGGAHQISERFFNIWFLMRRSSRRQKKELYCLSKFLETFYGDELDNIARHSLINSTSQLDHITYALAMAEVVKDKEIRQQLLEHSYSALHSLAKDNPELYGRFNLNPQGKSPNNKAATGHNEADLLELIKMHPEDAANWFSLGVFYMLTRSLDYSAAEKAFLKAAELKPNDADIYSNLGYIYADQPEKFEQAEEALLKAIQLNPNSKSAYESLGYLYKDKPNKFEDAITYFLKAIEIDPNNANNYNSLGNLYTATIKFDEAEKAYLKSALLQPEDSLVHYNLGNLYRHQQRFDDAEKALLKAIEIKPDYELAFNNLGNIYWIHMKKFQEAEKAYLRALEINPNYAGASNNLGNLYKEQQNKFQEAERAYFKAIEIIPHYSGAYKNLGNLYKEQRDKFQQAEQAYLKAIEIDPDYASAYNNLGDLYQDQSFKFLEAEKAYLKALEIDSTIDSAKYNLVFLYRDKLNKISEAEKWFAVIECKEGFEDSFYLNKALFELYKKNEGHATEHFQIAASFIKNQLPKSTQDDWWRFAAVSYNLGYGLWLISQLEKKELDVALAPYYIAVKALTEKDSEGFLLSKAVEIREPSRQILKIIQKMMN